MIFRNNCGAKVFILWCGDLKYTRKKCGDGPNGGYYTYSDNIGAGKEVSANIAGRYSYNACMGSIGFDSAGYRNDASGGVTCLCQNSQAKFESKISKGSPPFSALLQGGSARGGG